MKHRLLPLALALSVLCHSTLADTQTLARLNLADQATNKPLTPELYSGKPLSLPSGITAGNGNRIEIVTDEATDRRALLISKATDAPRASFSFNWPAGTLPPSGIFELNTTLRMGAFPNESGNFTINVYAPQSRILTLQIGRTGTLQLITANGTVHTAGRLPAPRNRYHTITLQLNYSTREVHLLLNGSPTSHSQPLPLGSDQAPNSVVFATATATNSSRQLEFERIDITHTLGSY